MQHHVAGEDVLPTHSNGQGTNGTGARAPQRSAWSVSVSTWLWVLPKPWPVRVTGPRDFHVRSCPPRGRLRLGRETRLASYDGLWGGGPSSLFIRNRSPSLASLPTSSRESGGLGHVRSNANGLVLTPFSELTRLQVRKGCAGTRVTANSDRADPALPGVSHTGGLCPAPFHTPTSAKGGRPPEVASPIPACWATRAPSGEFYASLEQPTVPRVTCPRHLSVFVLSEASCVSRCTTWRPCRAGEDLHLFVRHVVTDVPV